MTTKKPDRDPYFIDFPARIRAIQAEMQREDLDVYLDTLWARLVDQSSLVRLWGGELPAPGQRSTVRIYCYDKPAVFVYWKSMLAAELGQ